MRELSHAEVLDKEYMHVLYLSVTSLSRCRVRDKSADNVSRCVDYRKEELDIE